MSRARDWAGESTPADLVSFCQELVQAPSFTGNEKAVADIVTAKCLRLDFDCVQTDAWGNVIAVREGLRSGPALMLDGHMDVVSVADRERWQHHPFGGELSEGKLWGRGSADTKCALAALLFAATALPRSAFAGRIILVASVCEETLTGAALRQVITDYHPDIFVTGEPTGLRLAEAQKGRFSLALQAAGKSAHTSTPQAGENAVYKMMEAIRRLRQLDLPEDPLLGKSILELTEIHSQPSPNESYVPYGCQARMIGRIMPGNTRENVLVWLRDAVQDLPGTSLDFINLQQTCYTGQTLHMQDFLPGWRNRTDDPWQQKILAGFDSAGLSSETFGFPGGTNASAAGELGISSFIYGPGRLEQAHTVDEWVQVSEVHAARLGFEALISACLA